jgi:hypothetical protein
MKTKSSSVKIAEAVVSLLGYLRETGAEPKPEELEAEVLALQVIKEDKKRH